MRTTTFEKTSFCGKDTLEIYAPIRHPLPSTSCLHEQSQDCSRGLGATWGELMGLKQEHSWETLLNKGFCSALAAAQAGWMKTAVKYVILIKKQSYM